MYTQCTACLVWFKVSSDQLHAAHGLVRCSACGTVFNALASLRHDLPGAHAEATSTARPSVVDTGTDHAQTEADAPASAPVPTQDVAEEDAADNRQGQAGGEGQAGVSEPSGRHVESQAHAGDDADEDRAHSDPTSGTAVRFEPDSVDEEEFLRDLGADTALRRPGARWLWGIALALALLVLAGQLVYAARAPIAGFLGFASGPALKLSDYVISKAALDAVPDSPATLRLSGTLRNDANHRQRLPLLRVALTDRYGEVIGAQVLAPRQYGAGPQAALHAHQRFMFHVEFADPGVNAVGFTLVLCKHRDRALWCQEGS